VHLPTRAQLPPRPYEQLDRIADRVAVDLNAPVAMVSLVSTEGESLVGLSGLPEPWATERWAPLSHSFSQHVVTGGSPVVIENAHDDPLVVDSAAILDLGFVAYAGIPLRGAHSDILGAVAVADHCPRQWVTWELAQLAAHAQACSIELGWRRAG
jgi:GAF domain-containing protein